MEKVWKHSFKYFNNRSNSGVITNLFQSSLANLQILSRFSRLSFRLCSKISSYFERQNLNMFNNSKGIASKFIWFFLLQKSNHVFPLSKVILLLNLNVILSILCFKFHSSMIFCPTSSIFFWSRPIFAFGEKSNSKSG